MSCVCCSESRRPAQLLSADHLWEEKVFVNEQPSNSVWVIMSFNDLLAFLPKLLLEGQLLNAERMVLEWGQISIIGRYPASDRFISLSVEWPSSQSQMTASSCETSSPGLL